MNKWITGLFAVALTGSTAFADVAPAQVSAKDLDKVVEDAVYLETATKGVVLSGYVDAGYTYNFNGNAGVFGRSVGDGTPGGDFNLNALKITLQKGLSDKNEFQAGFRADVKLGEDAGGMGGAGNGTAAGTLNGDAINVDQAYVIVRAPIGNGLDISAGKFYSLLGYEVDDRPANLNITYGYDFTFVTTQQTGLKLYYPLNDIVEFQFAITNGSGLDTNSPTAGGFSGGLPLFGSDNDGYGITGTVNVKAPGGNANWFNGVYTSFGAADGFTSLENESVIVYNSWGNWAPKFANDKLLLGFSGTLTNVDDVAIFNANDSYTFVTGSLYSKYQFTDIFSLAARASYFHSDDSAAIAQGFFGATPFTVPTFVGPQGGGDDIYSWTLTAGFNLLENFMIRAEYRVDMGKDVQLSGVFPFPETDVANTVAVQAVYTF